MNICILIGRLTRDPEIRYLQSGTAVAQFTLAVDKQLSRDKKQEFEAQGKPTADFIRIVAWGKLAENCANYDIMAREVKFLDSAKKKTEEFEEVPDFDDIPF